ncbi:hypothetical protein TKK_0014523 [Trichogramma kaykai]
MRVSPKGALPPDHGPDFHRMARTCTHSLNTNPKLPHCKTACPLESNTIHRVGRVAIRARAPLYPELRRPYETLLNPYKATKGIAKPKIEIEYQAIVLKSHSYSHRLPATIWTSIEKHFKGFRVSIAYVIAISNIKFFNRPHKHFDYTINFHFTGTFFMICWAFVFVDIIPTFIIKSGANHQTGVYISIITIITAKAYFKTQASLPIT